jgi:hypothetical protein
MPSKDEIAEFSKLIRDIAYELEISHMDAIINHCDETGMEVEVASTLLSSALKSQIKEEAQSLNLIKKNSKLPI